MNKFHTILLDQASRTVLKNLNIFVKDDINQVKDYKGHFLKVSEGYDNALIKNAQVRTVQCHRYHGSRIEVCPFAHPSTGEQKSTTGSSGGCQHTVRLQVLLSAHRSGLCELHNAGAGAQGAFHTFDGKSLMHREILTEFED